MKYGIVPTNPLEWMVLKTRAVPIVVVDMLAAPMKTRVIMTGVKLGIFEALRDGHRSAGDVAAALHLDVECTELLMRALVAFDYLIERDGRFGLSPLSRDALISGGRMEQFGYVLWNYTQVGLIDQMDDVVRTGRGVDIHSTMHDAEAWRYYQQGQLESARVDAPIVAARVPVRKGATELLDLAGSHGLFGAAICRRHPPMRSTVLDLPQAVEHARRLAEHEGIADIIDHRAGDLLHGDLGSPVDVVVLSNILHHFTPQDNATILSRARATLKADGTVVIWELEAPKPDARPAAGDVVALFFRVTSTARAYHGEEYAAWLTTAGFGGVKISRFARRPGAVLVTARVAG